MKKFYLLLTVPVSWSAFTGSGRQLTSKPLRYEATLYGVGFTNILDTYLSPMEYTGPEIRILRESMRMTKLMNGNVSVKVCSKPICP